MSTISVVIISQDNEDIIKNCLESAKWANEIIVLDAFSKDKTAEICREYTDKVYQREWAGNTMSQKNFALQKANCDWIFVLDTDEVITDFLTDEIKKNISTNKEEVGFYVPRKNIFFGRWIKNCGLYPDYNVRLFKKGSGIYEDREHGLLKIEGKIGYLKHNLIHNAYRTIEEYFAKINFYTDEIVPEMLQQTEQINIKKIKWLMIKKSIKVFRKMYLKQKGYKEGFVGFLICALYSFYQILLYSKYWELMQREKKG